MRSHCKNKAGVIRQLEVAEGPEGLDNDFATYYPAGGGLSATWNTELAYTFGFSVGEETRARDKDVLLSPAINIIRTPLGGRTYEYFTEDPFLNKKLTVPFVVGMQENDVAVCVKHYAANNQETNRDFVDVQIDERTLREIYLPAFKDAVVEAKAYSMMGAYNKFRGDYLCENSYMLNDVLRDEWGFEGIEYVSGLYNEELKPQIIKGLLTKFDFTLPNNAVEQEIDAKVREKTRGFTEEQHKSYMEDKGKLFGLRKSSLFVMKLFCIVSNLRTIISFQMFPLHLESRSISVDGLTMDEQDILLIEDVY